jgi:hypothetical protein
MTSPTTWNSLGFEAAAGAAPAGSPQEAQKRAPSTSGFPHRLHVISSLLLPAGFVPCVAAC